MPAELKWHVPVRLSEASIVALSGSEQDIANRIAELEAALRPFAATADKLDAVRVRGSWMTKEYEAGASIVGWRYEDAVRARELLKS